MFLGLAAHSGFKAPQKSEKMTMKVVRCHTSTEIQYRYVYVVFARGGRIARLSVHIFVERLGVTTLRRRSRWPVNHEHWFRLLSPHVIDDEHDEKNGTQQADHSATNYA